MSLFVSADDIMMTVNIKLQEKLLFDSETWVYF
jgi:hypothetical protein